MNTARFDGLVVALIFTATLLLFARLLVIGHFLLRRSPATRSAQPKLFFNLDTVETVFVLCFFVMAGGLVRETFL